MYPSTVRKVAVAPSPRPGAATLTQATGLSQISVPPTVQSSRFLNAPGRVPAYSGAQISTASAASMAARIRATAAGSGSRSSSGLKCGSPPSPSYIRVRTPACAATARAVRSNASLAEWARRLPDSSRIITEPPENG
ncbi:hypothetical protein BJ996_003481 [Streptomyces phaeogriseichromatogenes]|nr:hypothetical protein [Streptomyces murinus]